jgi:hypothetical protein
MRNYLFARGVGMSNTGSAAVHFLVISPLVRILISRDAAKITFVQLMVTPTGIASLRLPPRRLHFGHGATKTKPFQSHRAIYRPLALCSTQQVLGLKFKFQPRIPVFSNYVPSESWVPLRSVSRSSLKGEVSDAWSKSLPNPVRTHTGEA